MAQTPWAQVSVDGTLGDVHEAIRTALECLVFVDRQDLQLCVGMMAMHQKTVQTGKVKCLAHMALMVEVAHPPNLEHECRLMCVVAGDC